MRYYKTINKLSREIINRDDIDINVIPFEVKETIVLVNCKYKLTLNIEDKINANCYKRCLDDMIELAIKIHDDEKEDKEYKNKIEIKYMLIFLEIIGLTVLAIFMITVLNSN